MPDQPPQDESSRSSTWLSRFLDAHPDGDDAAFEAWLAGQAELGSDPGLAEELRRGYRDWRDGLAALGVGPHDDGDHSFFGSERSRRLSDPETHYLHPGKRIGRFELTAFIARGGMGQVWAAQDSGLRRPVALKLVLPERVDTRALDLFAREARAGGRLHHPNIVTTLDFGTDKGLTWIAQELVDGSRTLKDALDDLRSGEGVPRGYYRRVAELVARIADALQAAHDAGVIHRDVKPANVLITHDDTPKLTDFGLARVSGDSLLSVTGDFAGTWSYMSPEQVTAKRMGLDHRTDVFSLGVVLYELLTLRKPFDGDTTHQVAQRIIGLDPPLASKVRSQCPEELAIICGKAIEKLPDARYASAAEMAADLRRHLADEPIEARPPGLAARGWKLVRRNPAVSAAVSIGALALITVSSLAAHNAGLVTDLSSANATAQRSLQRAEGVLDFWERTMRSVDPSTVDRPNVTVRAVLDRSSATLVERFGDDPEMLADMHEVLSEAYDSLSLLDQKYEHIEAELALRWVLDPEGSARIARLHVHLAENAFRQGRLDDAERLAREGVRLSELFSEEYERLSASGSLAAIQAAKLSSPAIEDLVDMVVAWIGNAPKRADEDPESVREEIWSGVRAVDASMRAGRVDEASAVIRKLAEDTITNLPGHLAGDMEPEEIGVAIQRGGEMFGEAQETRVAEALYLVGLDLVDEGVGRAGLRFAQAELALARFYLRQGRGAEALEAAVEAQDLILAAVDPSHPEALFAALVHADALLALGRDTEARALLRTARTAALESADFESEIVWRVSRELFPLERPDPAAAVAFWADTIEALDRELRRPDEYVFRARIALAQAQLEAGALVDARRVTDEALDWADSRLRRKKHPDALPEALELAATVARAEGDEQAAVAFEDRLRELGDRASTE